MATNKTVLDFSNTQIAFSGKSDDELKKTAWLFKVMNHPMLTKFLSFMGVWVTRLRLPISTSIIKRTIFEQFCGGTTLLESQRTINKLETNNVLSVLDYGAEAKETEHDFDATMNEFLRAIEFASLNDAVPVISAKITGMARFELLEKVTKGEKLSEAEQREFDVVLKRVDAVCHKAHAKNVGVFIDAEESWIQQAVDDLVDKMMERYNQNRVIVYNTFQLYRHDRLGFLKRSFERALSNNYLLGAKLVRGAYMDKERKRALEMGYVSPIQPNKEATDHDYNAAVKFCLDHYERISMCNATHNQESCKLMAESIDQMNVSKNHAHLNFCQLYGMSDNLTFNLASAGYNAAKYLPYGPVRDVIPYLVRRAQENSSITGDISREYDMILKEMKRRGF